MEVRALVNTLNRPLWGNFCITGLLAIALIFLTIMTGCHYISGRVNSIECHLFISLHCALVTVHHFRLCIHSRHCDYQCNQVHQRLKKVFAAAGVHSTTLLFPFACYNVPDTHHQAQDVQKVYRNGN